MLPRIHFCLLLTLCVCLASFAQTMIVHTTSGQSTFQLSQIDSITFTSTSTAVDTTIGALHDPILAIQFDEYIYNHNTHIASDGAYLYTVNGGNYSYGMIKKYSMNGTYLATTNILLDFRSIMYNRKDGYFYTSGFESDWSERNLYKLTDMVTGTFQRLYTNLYDYNQASLAFSWDGNYVYAFNQGTLKKYSLSSGLVVQTITGLQYGSGNFGGDGAVAVDADYIYTWDSSTRTVYVYTLSGSFVRTLSLPYGDTGFSLSYVNGYLFVSRDGNYGTGTWYGYNIRRSTTSSAISAKQIPVQSNAEEAAVPKVSDSTR